VQVYGQNCCCRRKHHHEDKIKRDARFQPHIQLADAGRPAGHSVVEGMKQIHYEHLVIIILLNCTMKSKRNAFPQCLSIKKDTIILKKTTVLQSAQMLK
jgi:hypothetical protein